MRVHAAEVMEEAQNLADLGNYSQGEAMLERMNCDLMAYSQDEVLIGMQKNCIKQKDMLSNERLGIRSDYNRKAYATNMNKCFMEQEAAPQFQFNAYQNKTRAKKSSQMSSLKGLY